MHAHAVGDVDRLVGIVDADVDVHAEDQLLARNEAKRRDQIAVAGTSDDSLVLPHRKRVGPGRADGQILARRRLRDLLAQRPQLFAGMHRVGARFGRDLEH